MKQHKTLLFSPENKSIERLITTVRRTVSLSQLSTELIEHCYDLNGDVSSQRRPECEFLLTVMDNVSQFRSQPHSPAALMD
jgi:hypothetical protein